MGTSTTPVSSAHSSTTCLLWNPSIVIEILHLQKHCIQENVLVNIINKTAGYHRHIFRPPILLTIPFRRIKTLFFKKYYLYVFSIFPNIKISNFFLQEKWKRPSGIISFNTHSTGFWNNSSFFSKKTDLFFKKKTQIRKLWEILLFQSHSASNLQ